MTRLDAIRQRVERATPGPWRWGYWTHRPDLKKQGNSGSYAPYWEFRAEDPDGYEELVLSTADYGTVAELPRPAYDAHVVSSMSAGYGGETTIKVRDEDKPLIAHSREDIPALLAVADKANLKRNTRVTADKKFEGEWVAIPGEDFDALRAALAPLLQEVER